MAFSVYKVACVACQSRSCFVCTELGRINKATTRLISHANDFVNAKSHAREKPLLAGYIKMELSHDILDQETTNGQ